MPCHALFTLVPGPGLASAVLLCLPAPPPVILSLQNQLESLQAALAAMQAGASPEEASEMAALEDEARLLIAASDTRNAALQQQAKEIHGQVHLYL